MPRPGPTVSFGARMIRYVAWDWNGTLLDDVDGCVHVLNRMLGQRGLGSMTRDTYRERFGFPVRPFYETLGFDCSPGAFAALSEEFIAAYRGLRAEVSLHEGALDVLARLGRCVQGQLVVSAMEHSLLGLMLADYGVLPHLQTHRGTRDLQAGSKVEIGVAALSALSAAADEIVFVGDTEHDHEVAEAAGCQCVLLSQGHQNERRLRLTGRPVLSTLAGVVSWVEAQSAARW